jgi:hypothetical protein
MSKQGDGDGKPAIKPTDIVGSLSLLVSPAIGSQIELRKENELSDPQEQLVAHEHLIFAE